MEELSKNNFLSKNFVNSENIYQVRYVFAGIVRNEFSVFDYLITKIFLGLDIFSETRFVFKTHVNICTNFKCKSMIFIPAGVEKKLVLR